MVRAGLSQLMVCGEWRESHCHTGAMSDQKTVPTDASVDDFLAAVVPEPRRLDGLRLAEVFGEVTGAEPVLWGPTMIGYGSYRYVSPSDPRRSGEWPRTAFSPRKARHSLYGLKDLPEGEALLPSLGAYAEGAGCVSVTRLDRIDLDVLRRLIAIAWSRPSES